MNKQPSYSTDQSLSSQYGYNTWGVWRDNRNVAPSTFSTKSYQKPRSYNAKSFSIILTTAACIVLLAVISIAGLAFYFSSIKVGLDECKCIKPSLLLFACSHITFMFFLHSRSYNGIRRILSCV